MRLEAADEVARALLREHGLSNWTTRFDRALRRGGACFYRKRVISLSRVFVEQNAEAVVEDTIRHEVAHALAWEHDGETGHGTAWRKWCEVTGAEPRARYDEDEVVMPEPRYRCTVLANEVRWSHGSGAGLQMGTTRISLEKGAVFGRHRLTRRLRMAVSVGLVSVFDTRMGEWVEG